VTFGGARAVLSIGIGGGGDVVGALAVAEAAREAGCSARVGGVTWERRVVDPIPGPRRIAEIENATPLNDGAVLAGSDTRGPGGFLFAESNMAKVLGEPVLLVDPNVGPRAVAESIDHAAAQLGCDLVVLVDVGGDVLGHGDEPGLASPLCDAILLAAAAHMGTRCIGAVFGTGCDGELTPDEVLERLAEVAAAGGSLGAWGLTPSAAERVAAAVEVVPTEASAMALEGARGGYGRYEIRGGRRTVPVSPLGAITFFYDPIRAMASAARLAAAVAACGSLDEAQEILAQRGVRTELDWEREQARVS
jgi:hypothetical protein